MSRVDSPAIYNDAFFDSVSDGALRSARVVVPILLELIQPASVIDIGCGRGAWLRAFQENGVQTIKGFDGDYVDRSKLLIDPSCFNAVNLDHCFQIESKYELAVCLEVAEHLPTQVGKKLVSTLTTAAPVVLFSAAIPGQTGPGHINEQWPWYWRTLFATHGFHRLDPIRPRVWQDTRVEWWYRQNVFLFVSEQTLAHSPKLRDERIRTDAEQLECLHPNILLRYTTLRGMLQELPRVAWRTLQRKLNW
ncbi:MAG: methyltransferase domain-containing protein [Acidobacteriota bacterium]